MEEKQATTTINLTDAAVVVGVRQTMDEIQQEIIALKNGSLKESTARIVTGMRRQQFRGYELTLQAARLDKQIQPMLRKQFGALPPATNGDEQNNGGSNAAA